MTPSEPSVSFKLPASRLTWRAADGRQLSLTPQTMHDAAPINDAVAASLPELRAFFPWAHGPQPTLEQRLERCKQANADYWAGRDMILSLRDEAGAYLACFGLHWRTMNKAGLEIGYWADSRHAGRGNATEGTRALALYCFDWLGCTRVQCAAVLENAASLRVIEKAGFAREGVLRNFSTPPTAELRAAGFKAGGDTVMHGLVPEDLGALAWVAELRKTLDVRDWQGEVATPAHRGPAPR